jgi:hypothetical protein
MCDQVGLAWTGLDFLGSKLDWIKLRVVSSWNVCDMKRSDSAKLGLDGSIEGRRWRSSVSLGRIESDEVR